MRRPDVPDPMASLTAFRDLRKRRAVRRYAVRRSRLVLQAVLLRMKDAIKICDIVNWTCYPVCEPCLVESRIPNGVLDGLHRHRVLVVEVAPMLCLIHHHLIFIRHLEIAVFYPER